MGASLRCSEPLCSVEAGFAVPLAITDVISHAIDHTRNQIVLQITGQLYAIRRPGEFDEHIVNHVLSSIRVADEDYSEPEQLDLVLVVDLPKGVMTALFEPENNQPIFYHRPRLHEE